MGVPPWDLMDKPVVWFQMARAAEAAEAQATANRKKPQAGMGARGKRL